MFVCHSHPCFGRVRFGHHSRRRSQEDSHFHDTQKDLCFLPTSAETLEGGSTVPFCSTLSRKEESGVLKYFIKIHNRSHMFSRMKEKRVDASHSLFVFHTKGGAQKPSLFRGFFLLMSTLSVSLVSFALLSVWDRKNPSPQQPRGRERGGRLPQKRESRADPLSCGLAL